MTSDIDELKLVPERQEYRPNGDVAPNGRMVTPLVSNEYPVPGQRKLTWAEQCELYPDDPLVLAYQALGRWVGRSREWLAGQANRALRYGRAALQEYQESLRELQGIVDQDRRRLPYVPREEHSVDEDH